ncbi:MAG: PilN domain-containing protein [Gammaproteobacteria bacterium]|nr:PilN domain-containing protein [Gammaproteobacteria bacterium]
MRLEVDNFKLFGLDLNQIMRAWVRGLKKCVPAGFETAFVNPAPRIVAELVDDQLILSRVQAGSERREIAALGLESLDVAAAGALVADIQDEGRYRLHDFELDLYVPADRVLHRNLRLPSETRDSLREVLGYQLARLTPFPVEKLYFDVRASDQDLPEDQLDAQLCAIPRDEIDATLLQVERLTHLPVARLLYTPSAEAEPFNLFGHSRARSPLWRRLNFNCVLMGILLLLVGAAVALPLYKKHAFVLERKQQIAELQRSVQDVEQKQAQLSAGLALVNTLVAQRQATVTLSDILAELTEIVPDNIYLRDLRVQGGKITISGSGTDVVGLIEQLNASPIFDGARFTSSVSRNARTGEDQFSAVFDLVPLGSDSP